MLEKDILLQQLKTELEKAKEEVKAANKHKSEFVANMSHVMRTPLNTVIGYSEMLQEETLDKGLVEYTANLAKITDSSKQLMDIINDVLDLSKIETGKIEFFLEDVQLTELLTELESTIQPWLKKNHNTFQLVLATDVNIIHTDIVKLRQSLLNLLSNANKFTQNGKITLEVKSVLQDDKNMLKFMISDTGVGLSPGQLENLAQILSHANISTTYNFGGYLGLYLTKRFCEMLGGWITVESEENKGSVFSIMLPPKAVISPEGAIQSGYFSEVNKSEKKTVLIIDDTPKVHRQLQVTLGKAGFTVLHAFNGEEGLKLARITRPDVIVLDVSNVFTFDITTPVMDGWAALSALKADSRLSEIPVIVMALVSEEHLGFNLKAVDYFHKPINIQALVGKIKSLVTDNPK